MSSHRESGDEAHVHDEAEQTTVAQAEQGELADDELEQATGGAGYMKFDGIDGESTDDKHEDEIWL